jgi:hypothetical protein
MPAAPRQPADHKKPAAQIEAEGIETGEVKWRGHTFTALVKDPEDWPVELTLAFEEGKPASGIRLMLGKQQWDELMATRPRNRDLGDLFDVIAATFGLKTSGE